jgi:hypothetical protein
MRPLLAIVAFASIGLSRPASAEPTNAEPPPTAPRVLTAPTAWLPPAGAVVGTGTLDHRGDGSAVVGVGLGGIAALDVGTDTDVRGCTICDGSDTNPIYLGRATFRMGVGQNALFHGMPALLIGARTTFASSGSLGRVRVSEVYAVASRTLEHPKVGEFRLHAGGIVFDASLKDTELGPKLRFVGGFEYRPPAYPKTTLMGDIAYVPLVQNTAIPDIDVEYLIGWGVRYQAFEWGSIELAVRHREAEGLGDSTVMVRVNGVFLPKAVRDAVRDAAKSGGKPR